MHEILLALGFLGRIPERPCLEGHHHDLPVRTTYHPYPTPDPYRSLVVLPVGVLGHVRSDGLPALAVHEHPPRGAAAYRLPDDPCFPDHPFHAGRHRPAPGRAHLAYYDKKRPSHEDRNHRQGDHRHPGVRGHHPGKQQATQDESHDRPGGGQAVVGHLEVHDDERERQEDQGRPRPIHRQHLKRIRREHKRLLPAITGRPDRDGVALRPSPRSRYVTVIIYATLRGRAISLLLEVVEALKAHRKRQAEERL